MNSAGLGVVVSGHEDTGVHPLAAAPRRTQPSCPAAPRTAWRRFTTISTAPATAFTTKIGTLAAGDAHRLGGDRRGCRHVVKDRMERAGMQLDPAGAQALLNLRCVALNDEWEPFMNHHIQSENRAPLRQHPHQTPNPLIFAWSPERGARSTGYAQIQMRAHPFYLI